MIQDYIKERYGNNAEADWNSYISDSKILTNYTDKGFVTYSFTGDAALIHDMYVKPEYRNHTHSWELHDQVLNTAKKLGKRVMITFSDFSGKNHFLGIKAIKIAGFVPAFKTTDQFVFIKGI